MGLARPTLVKVVRPIALVLCGAAVACASGSPPAQAPASAGASTISAGGQAEHAAATPAPLPRPKPPSPESVTIKEPGGDAADPEEAALFRQLDEPWGPRNDKDDQLLVPLPDAAHWKR